MPAVTTLSEVDHCNMALSHLGISNQIQSINPPDVGSVTAQICQFWYPKCRDYVLKSAPWSFAFTSLILTSDSTVFPGYQYAYQYPGDCLQAVAVTTIAGQRSISSYWWGYWWPQAGLNFALPKIPYKIVQSQVNPGQLAICCDLPTTGTTPLYVLYIQAVTNTQLFSSMFSDALSFHVASRIGGALRADPARVQATAQAYAMARAEALAQVFNEMQQDPEADSPSTIARW